ncbi:MAG: hypothetical protein ABW170_19200 [Candidatus Thiodiazotropha sp. L084R]
MGCQRSSAFGGLGCPKKHHEIEDSLDNPMGSCMVSSEGACAAYWSYGRFRQPNVA